MSRWLLFVFAGVLTSSSFASTTNCSIENTSNCPKTYDGKSIVPRPNFIYADGGRALREKKKFYVHLSAGVIAFEGQVSWYMNPQSLLNLSYMFQKDTVAGGTHMGSVSVSRFVGDDLYFRGGPGYRVGTQIDYLESVGSRRQGIRSHDYGVDLGVGHRWHMENWSFGVEWFAIYFPIIASQKTKDFDFQFRLMMVQVGYSF